MSMQFTEKTARQFILDVSDAHHAMAGGVIAISAAQAAALGEACLQISLDNQIDRLDWASVSARIEQMAHLKNTLTTWCDQDATTLLEYYTLTEAGDAAQGQRLLCESPAEISRLAVEGATILQDFRPLVSEQVKDDLEMALLLLTSTGRAALLLLDSNLRIWADNPALQKEFEPILVELETQLEQLTPLRRIR